MWPSIRLTEELAQATSEVIMDGKVIEILSKQLDIFQENYTDPDYPYGQSRYQYGSRWAGKYELGWCGSGGVFLRLISYTGRTVTVSRRWKKVAVIIDFGIGGSIRQVIAVLQYILSKFEGRLNSIEVKIEDVP